MQSKLLNALSFIWREDSNRGQRWRRILFFLGWQFWKRTVGTPLGATLCNGLRAISGVKIDVEGHENAVLRGMRSFLKDQRPPLVMFEYLARTDIVQTLKTFDEVEYSVFELAADGPRTASDRIRPLQDLFACPNELAKRFGILEPSRTSG